MSRGLAGSWILGRLGSVPAYLIPIGIGIWLFDTALKYPLVSGLLGFLSVSLASQLDPTERMEYLLPPDRPYRLMSIGRKQADLAYLKSLLDRELGKLDEDERVDVQKYLKSLGLPTGTYVPQPPEDELNSSKEK